MSNMKFTSLVLGAVLLTATACTKDELADGDRLPEAKDNTRWR